MFSVYQIVKVKDLDPKNLYRFGGENSENTNIGGPSYYKINDLMDKHKNIGMTMSISNFLKPSIKDLVEFNQLNMFYEIYIAIPRTELKDFVTILDEAKIRHNFDNWSDPFYSNYYVHCMVWFEKGVAGIEFLNFSRYQSYMWRYKNNTISPSRLLELDYGDLDNSEITKKNIIRFFKKHGPNPVQLIGRDFVINSFQTEQELFDRRSCTIDLVTELNLYDLFGGLPQDIDAQLTLADGTFYTLSNLRSIQQAPDYDYEHDLNSKTLKFRISLTFNNWQVYPKHKDEICSTDSIGIRSYPYKFQYDYKPVHYMFESDVDKLKYINLQDEVFKQSVEKLRDEIDKELCKNIGIDFSKDKDHTATAIVEEEKRKSLKHAYMKYCNDDNYNLNLDNLFKDLDKNNNNLEIKKEKESDIMKINNKELKQIIIDEDRNTVTTITEVPAPLFGLEPSKNVSVAKTSDKDEFDPYVGVAMTLAYQLFGSKENFRKFVRENELVRNLKKEREAREAAKAKAKEKAEEAKKKAAAKRAKQAENEEETATELLKKLSKFLNKSKKTKTKKGE